MPNWWEFEPTHTTEPEPQPAPTAAPVSAAAPEKPWWQSIFGGQGGGTPWWMQATGPGAWTIQTPGEPWVQQAPKWIQDLVRFKAWQIPGAVAGWHEAIGRIGQIGQREPKPWEDVLAQAHTQAQALPPNLRYGTEVPRPPWQRAADEAVSVAAQAPGYLWGEGAQKSGILRGLEGIGVLGIEAIRQADLIAKQQAGAAMFYPAAQKAGVDVLDYAPLTSYSGSMAKEMIKADWVEMQRGKAGETGPRLPGPTQLAMEDIAAGRKTAEEIGEEVFDIWAEMAFESVVSPLNIIDVVFGAAKVVKAGYMKRAIGAVGEVAGAKGLAKAAKLERAMVSLSDDAKAIQQAAEAAHEAIQKAGLLGRAGEALAETAPPWLKTIGRSAKWIVDLLPQAKAERDLGQFWMAVMPVVGATDDPRVALTLLQQFADAPEALAKVAGNVPVSNYGQKAQVILKHGMDDIANLAALNVKPGETLNAGKFMAEMNDALKPLLMKAHGYKGPPPGLAGGMLKLASGMKRIMSELYLNPLFSPGYVMRQLGSELTVPIIDGINPLSMKAHYEKYLDDFGITSRRIETKGVGRKTQLTGIPEEATARGPRPKSIFRLEESVFGRKPSKYNILARASERSMRAVRIGGIGGGIPIGEEARYLRGFAEWLKKFMDTNWRVGNFPPMEPELIAKLGSGPGGLDDLLHRLGREHTEAVKRDVVGQFLTAHSAGQVLAPSKYLDDITMAVMDPEVYRMFVDELGKLPQNAPPDDVLEVVAKLRKAIDEGEAKKLKDLPRPPPLRTVASEAAEVELAEIHIQSLREAAKRSGRPELVQRADEIAERLKAYGEELAKERQAMIVSAMAMDDPHAGMAIVLNANQHLTRAQNETRRLMDQWLAWATKEYRRPDADASAVWLEYFGKADENYGVMRDVRRGAYQVAQEQIGRLKAGEQLDDILGAKAWQLRHQQMMDMPIIPDAPTDFQPVSVKDPGGDKAFQAMLGHSRARVDYARQNAWRATYGAESGKYSDILDVLDSAEAQVAVFAKQTVGEVAGLRDAALEAGEAAWKAGDKAEFDRIWTTYQAQSHKLWMQYTDDAVARWEYTRGEVMLAGTGELWPARDVPVAPAGAPPIAPTGRQPDIREVQRIARKPKTEVWTPEERATMHDWLHGAPDPDAAEPFTRESFIDWMRDAGIPEAQITGEMQVMDAMAKVWAKRTGRSVDDFPQWYDEHIAEALVGERAKEALEQSGMLYQEFAERAPMWYTKADRVLQAKMPNKASPQQIAGILRKGGVKKEELKWSGILDWLDNQKAKSLTKDEVLEFLLENQIQVEEVVYGGSLEEVSRELQQLNARHAAGETLSQAEEASRMRMEGELSQGKLTGTRYASLAHVLPGGEPGTYRELLFKMPVTPAQGRRGTQDAIVNLVREDLARSGGLTDEIEDAISAWAARPDEVTRAQFEEVAGIDLANYYPAAQERATPVGTFRDPHWPDDPGTFLHMRFREQLDDAGKRGVMIQEVQSGLHQKARGLRTDEIKRLAAERGIKQGTPEWKALQKEVPQDFGYGPQLSAEEIDRLKRKRYDLQEALTQIRDDVRGLPAEQIGAERAQRHLDLLGAFNENDQLLRQAENVVPDAPFKNTWDELAFKRMMRWAAENDFEWIGWTTGKQQVERNAQALRQVVDRLEYTHGIGQLEGIKNGKVVIQHRVKDADELRDLVGKKIAADLTEGKNMMQSGPKSGMAAFVEGDDLTVGGEFYKLLYDTSLPSFAKKASKRWKGEVGTGQIFTGAELENWSVRRTPSGNYAVFTPEGNLWETGFATMEEAGNRASRMAGTREVETIHRLNLTPQMRDDIMSEGLSLFQGKKGATQFLDDGKAVLHAFEGADISTVLHELGHIFERMLDPHDTRIFAGWATKEADRLNALAKAGKLPARLRARLFVDDAGKAVDTIAPLRTDGRLSRAGKELFSTSYERYRSEGIAPTLELQSIFDRFTEWLREIYRTIKGSEIDVNLNDEVRGVFDRMLAEEPLARAGEELAPLRPKDVPPTPKPAAVEAAPAAKAAPVSRGPSWDQPALWQEAAEEATPQQRLDAIEAANASGYATRPLQEELIQHDAEINRMAVDKMGEGVAKDWQKWTPQIQDQGTEDGILDWFNGQYLPQWRQTKAAAVQYAKTMTDYALLDYNNFRGFDMALSYVIPYHFWYTRSGWNWMQRFSTRPGMAAQWIRTREAMKLANENAGRRQRFGHMIPVPFPWLPDWMGDTLYVDPISYFMPFDNIFNIGWDDSDEARYGLSKIHGTMERLGMRMYPIYEFPYQTGMWQKLGEGLGMDPETAQKYLGPETPDEFGTLLPMTGSVKALSALAREKGIGEDVIPPGGLALEGMPRDLLGLPRGDAYDPYRVGRMLGNIAAEDKTNLDTTILSLIGQELLLRDEDQRGEVWKEDAPIAQEVAAEFGFSPEMMAQAQAMLAEAMQKATFETGVRTIGYYAGPRLAIEPRGERAQMEMAEEARAQVWDPETGEGSRADYQQFKMDQPAMYPRGTQYDLLPGGQDEYEAMSPAARANWLMQKGAEEELHGRVDTEVDEFLRRRPWDSEGIEPIEAQRTEGLAAIEEKYPLPPYEGEMPAILYGMSPEEAWESTVEKAMRPLREEKPDAETFADEAGDVNWDDYYKAEAEWEAGLPDTLPGVGPIGGGKYEGLSTKEAMDMYNRRYDSPLEAALDVYKDTVPGPAYERYHETDDWDSTVGAVGAVPAASLVDQILEAYPEKEWTREELLRELQGVAFPPMREQKDAEDRAEDAFWSLLKQTPNKLGARDDDYVQLMLNKVSRETATPEQVAKATMALGKWLKAHPDAAQARRENDQLWAQIEKQWPQASDLQTQYFALPKGDRRQAFLAAFPQLKQMWEFKDKFKAGHPVYVKYYDPGWQPFVPWDETESRGQGTSGGYAATAGGAQDTYWGRMSAKMQDVGWKKALPAPWWARKKYSPKEIPDFGEWYKEPKYPRWRPPPVEYGGPQWQR